MQFLLICMRRSISLLWCPLQGCEQGRFRGELQGGQWGEQRDEIFFFNLHTHVDFGKVFFSYLLLCLRLFSRQRAGVMGACPLVRAYFMGILPWAVDNVLERLIPKAMSSRNALPVKNFGKNRSFGSRRALDATVDG